MVMKADGPVDQRVVQLAEHAGGRSLRGALQRCRLHGR
jgi:hypothetical protein